MFSYLGQCDRLRRTPTGEQFWKQMIAQATPIGASEFKRLCRLETLLDEDETLEEFMADDETAGLYKSVWGGGSCLFIQTSGFEFIFVKDE